MRILLRAGVIGGLYKEPVNYKYSGAHSYVPNYTYEVSGKSAVGLILDPALEYTHSRSFGLTAGPYLLLSSNMIGGGLRVGLLLGKVGGQYRKRKQ
jgi:hypothetical protein